MGAGIQEQGTGRLDAGSRDIQKNLRFMEERSGLFTLFYKSFYTGVSVARSHEGYNHFAKWYVKDGGKITMDFDVKERELAMGAAIAFWRDKLADRLLKISEDKRNGSRGQKNHGDTGEVHQKS